MVDLLWLSKFQAEELKLMFKRQGSDCLYYAVLVINQMVCLISL